MDTLCHTCSTAGKPDAKNRMGLLTGLLLVILPKCPFCIMAFTGTALLCGEGTIIESTVTHNSILTIIITALLCLVTLAGILLNRRGVRTYYALALALAGMTMIMYSVIRDGGQTLYYSGILGVFTGVWLNGSLTWVYYQVKQGLKGVYQRERMV